MKKIKRSTGIRLHKKRTSAADIAMVALHESLTTPDSEDWSVIPDGDDVHVTAVREIGEGDERRVFGNSSTAPLSEFKRIVEQLPAGHDLGCVTVMILKDFEATGGAELLAWINGQAEIKNFSVMTTIGPASTKEAVRAMQAIIQRA